MSKCRVHTAEKKHFISKRRKPHKAEKQTRSAVAGPVT